MDQHRKVVRWMSIETLNHIIADLNERNLYSSRDHEVRWSYNRLKAAKFEMLRRIPEEAKPPKKDPKPLANWKHRQPKKRYYNKLKKKFY